MKGDNAHTKADAAGKELLNIFYFVLDFSRDLS